MGLRYGENPHQQAALYSRSDSHGANVVAARQLHGKNFPTTISLISTAALAIVRQFSQPAAAVVKHNNPCGVAVNETLVEALQRAMEGDPQSAFGSVLGLNRTVDGRHRRRARSARAVSSRPSLLPIFTTRPCKFLTTKPKWKNNVRLMEVGQLERSQPHWRSATLTAAC